jgi:hypothetical protein
MGELFDYLTMKQIALEFFDNEFVLNHAPSSYAHSTNKEEFLQSLKTKKEEVDSTLIQEELLNEFATILALKAEIIELRKEILSVAKVQHYEKMADLRIRQKAITNQLRDKKTLLESKSTDLLDEKNSNLLQVLVMEIVGFIGCFESVEGV